MRDTDKPGEQVAARQHQQRCRTKDGKLRKQQNRGDQIDHQERALVTWYKRPHLGQLYLGEWRAQQEGAK
jgi:hypothetical protein